MTANDRRRSSPARQAEAYEEVPNDLVNLGFVPASKIDELRQSGLTVAISRMLK